MEIQCYHEINEDHLVQGFLNFKTCSEIEDIIKYNVYNILEDNDIDEDEVNYICIYAHGSRVFGIPKKKSDIDFVLFYKGNIREDSLFNIFVDERIFIEHVRADFNPIQINDDSDIERYIQKHDIEYNNRINENLINLAVDDFDNAEAIEVQKKARIKDDVHVKNILELLNVNEILEKIKDGKNVSQLELRLLPEIYKKTGVKIPFSIRLVQLYINMDTHADLNWIDTSEVTSLYFLFAYSDFNGDISEWDVSNVTSMAGLFCSGDFNGDISKWNTKNVIDMHSMFYNTTFNRNISNWNVKKVKNMNSMFANSSFNRDISKWEIDENCDTSMFFVECPLQYNKRYWPKKFLEKL